MDKINIRQKLSSIAGSLIDSYSDQKGINLGEKLNLPQRDRIHEITRIIYSILFPGYQSAESLSAENISFIIDAKISSVYWKLYYQILKALHSACPAESCADCSCEEKSAELVLDFLRQLPGTREQLKKDISAAFHGDPAAKSYDEIILSYPFIDAIVHFRISHLLYEAEVPLIPRMITEHAHFLTGIDIHPGATIGDSFFIDHGTGVVIGETTVIGSNVKIYQGVTLGALSVPDSKKRKELRCRTQRHPTIEDNVVIYSDATILGGDTVIGRNSIIGGNVWITESVPPDSKVLNEGSQYIKKNR